jgi:hypothetical protein
MCERNNDRPAAPCCAIQFSERQLEALEIAFREWRSENAHALDLDGVGDLPGLLARLIAASQKGR